MHRPGVHRLNLSDGDTRLVWALPRGRFLPRPGGPWWDLDAEATEPGALRFRWADVVESLTRWCAAYAAPLLVDHIASATRLGEAESFGHVTGVREVTAAEASALGVSQPGDALYLAIEPTPDAMALLDAGRLPYTSPGLRAAYTADDGSEWPIVLRELSFTATPRQTVRQVPTHAAAALGAALLSEVQMGEEAEIEVKVDPVEALAKAVADIGERLAKLEAAAAMADKPAEPAAQMSETDRELARLRTQVATMAAEREIDALLSERELAPSARTHLIALHAGGHAAAAKAIVAAAPKRGTTLTRAPLAGAAVDLSDTPAEERARALAKSEGISLGAAWDRIHRKEA